MEDKIMYEVDWKLLEMYPDKYFEVLIELFKIFNPAINEEIYNKISDFSKQYFIKIEKGRI